MPGDLWQAILPDTNDAELRAIYGPLGASLAVYCHIHRAYVRRIGDLTVANTGTSWRLAHLPDIDRQLHPAKKLFSPFRGYRFPRKINWALSLDVGELGFVSRAQVAV